MNSELAAAAGVERSGAGSRARPGAPGRCARSGRPAPGRAARARSAADLVQPVEARHAGERSPRGWRRRTSSRRRSRHAPARCWSRTSSIGLRFSQADRSSLITPWLEEVVASSAGWVNSRIAGGCDDRLVGVRGDAGAARWPSAAATASSRARPAGRRSPSLRSRFQSELFSSSTNQALIVGVVLAQVLEQDLGGVGRVVDPVHQHPGVVVRLRWMRGRDHRRCARRPSLVSGSRVEDAPRDSTAGATRGARRSASAWPAGVAHLDRERWALGRRPPSSSPSRRTAGLAVRRQPERPGAGAARVRRTRSRRSWRAAGCTTSPSAQISSTGWSPVKKYVAWTSSSRRSSSVNSTNGLVPAARRAYPCWMT